MNLYRDISHNVITTVGRRVFKGAQSLRSLQLDNNQITCMEEHSFKGLLELEILWVYTKKKKVPIVSSIVCSAQPQSWTCPRCIHLIKHLYVPLPSPPLILQHAEQQQSDRTASQCLWGIGKIAGTAAIGQPIRLRLPFVLVVAFPTQRTTAGALHALPVAIAAEGPKRGGPARSGVQVLRYVYSMRGHTGVVALPNPETADGTVHCQIN